MSFTRAALILACSCLASSASAFTLGGTSSQQLGWDTRELSFNVNYTDCGVSEAVLDRAIDAAVELWNSVPTSGITLSRGGEVGTTYAQADTKITSRLGGNPSDLKAEDPEIICSLDFETDTGSSAAAVGGTTQYIAPDSPYLEYSFITLNSESGAAKASIANIVEDSGETALAILIAHEMGHALGLGHTGDRSALMYFSIAEKEHLALGQDDIDGITYLYPREELGGDGIFGCATLFRDPGDRGGSSGRGSPGGPAPYGALGLGLLFAFLVLTARVAKSTSVLG